MDAARIEAELHLDRFKFPQPSIHGDRCQLHDWPPRLFAARFEIDEDESFVR